MFAFGLLRPEFLRITQRPSAHNNGFRVFAGGLFALQGLALDGELMLQTVYLFGMGCGCGVEAEKKLVALSAP